MSNNEHSEARDAHRTFRCTFGPVREQDLVWPPPDEELDAFSVVLIHDGDQPEPPPPAEAAHAPAARAHFKPTFGDCRDPERAPRIRPLVFPMEPPPLPATPRVDGHPDELVTVSTAGAPGDASGPAQRPIVFPLAVETTSRDPEVTGARRSAWLAVFFAAACTLVTVVEYRAIVSLPGGTGAPGAEQPPVPEGVAAAELAPDVTLVVPPAASRSQAAIRTAEAPAPTTVKLDRQADEPARQATAAPVRPMPVPVPKVTPIAPSPAVSRPRLAVASPARLVPALEPAVSRVAVTVLDRGTVPAPAALAPPPPPAPAPVTATAALTEPATSASPAGAPRPAAAVLAEAVNEDETNIRSALTQFRTAYSQLDARAARAVWPSVDARALERAFHSLKSQELRFDRCSLTVTGARAQAACKGRAIYVPRIGDQSPRFTAREWTFELRKADERWTIASARTL